MFFPAMDLGWKRVHLLIFLIFLKYAVGSEGWIPQNDQSQQDWPVHKRFSPRGLQSSVLEAPATGSIPFEEVDPNVLPGKSSLTLTASSQKSSGLQNPNLLSAPSSSSTGSLGSYSSLFTSTYQGSSGPQLTGFRKLVSTSGLLAQSPSKDTPGLLYARFPASPLGFSHSPSGQSSYSQYTSSSQSSVGTPLKASLQYVPGQGSSYGLSVQPQGTSSQYAPALSLGGKLPVSSQYYQATQRGSLSPSWSSQERQPSTSRTQGFQASSTVLKGSGTSQSSSWSPSKFPSPSSAGGSISSSVQSQGTSSQKDPVPLGAKVSVYSQAAPSGSSLSLSRPSQWEPSSTRSQSLLLSGSETSQSSAPSQGFKAPSRLSSSAVSPGLSAPTQEGSGRYSGLSSLPQSAPTRYSLWSPASAKPGSSLLDSSSQSASGQSSYRQYTPSTQSRAGTQLPGSSPFVPVSTPTGGSSLQLQGTASLYAPAFLGAKVPVSSQTAPSGSLSLSQLSPWRPLSRLSQSSQTSGTVGSQSSSPSEGSRAPSKFSTLTSVASPTQFASTPEGSSRYSGMSRPSQSVSSSQSMTGTQLAGSKPFVKKAGLYAIGSSLQLQGSSSQKAPAALDGKVPVYSQAVSALSQTSLWKPSTSRWSQGFQASGTVASDSSSPFQGSKAPSRFSTITSQFASAQKESGRYSGLPVQTQSMPNPYSDLYAKLSASPLGVSQSTSTSNLYGPLRLSAKVPVYSQAAPSRPSLSQSQPPKWQTSSGWSQGFQTSDTVVLQSGSPAQGSKALSRLPTLASATSASQFASKQEGAGGYSGLSSLSQDAYSPGSPAYAKRGSSLSVSSQSTSNQISSGLYVSNSQSMPGTQLAGSNRNVPAQTGSTSTGVSLKIHSCNHHDPTVTCPCNNASRSGSPLTGSAASQSSVPQSSKSSIPSSLTSSFFGAGVRPSKLSAQAAAGSTIGSQISPGGSASVQYPSDSMTSSLGSSGQGDLQGILSGLSSDSTDLSSSYGSIYFQKASGYSKPSQGSFATG